MWDRLHSGVLCFLKGQLKSPQRTIVNVIFFGKLCIFLFDIDRFYCNTVSIATLQLFGTIFVVQ